MSNNESSTSGENAYGAQCLRCKHLIEWPYCYAFMSGFGIPDEIKRGEMDHTRPYPGDHGLRFTLTDSQYEISGRVMKDLLVEYAGEVILNDLRTDHYGEELSTPLVHEDHREGVEIIPDLITACAEGDIIAVKEFLSRGANVNASDRDRNTPLMVACRHCHPHVVEYLLQNGADVNAKDKYEKSALRIAYEWGYPTIVKLLKDFGAEE